MHDLQKATEIYNKKLAADSGYPQKIIEEWRKEMPDEFARFMFIEEYGCHIVDPVMYEEAVSLLKWAGDKGESAKWTVEEVKERAGVDFDEVDFYELDLAYVANMLYSDYCNIFTDTSAYMKMAVNYLTDSDYPGEADERAYKNAKKRIKYFE